MTRNQYADLVADRLQLLTGCVNLRPMWDSVANLWRDAGTLLLADWSLSRDAAGIRVAVYLSFDPMGWNNWQGKAMTDSKGRPIYNSAVLPAGWEYSIAEAVRVKK